MSDSFFSLFEVFFRTFHLLYSNNSRTISTILRLFALFSDYSPTICTIRRLFVDYSSTIRTIGRLFATFWFYQLPATSHLTGSLQLVRNWAYRSATEKIFLFLGGKWFPPFNDMVHYNQKYLRESANTEKISAFCHLR